MPSSKINQLFDKLEPRLATAFKDAVKDINSGIDFARLKKAITDRNVNAAISSLNLAPASFAALQGAVTDAYIAGAKPAQAALKGARNAEGHVAVIRFDVRDPLTEALINTRVNNLVGDISDDMLNAIRTTLENSLAKGEGPLSAARVIAGYVDKTGNRVGGTIGLTNAQAQRVIEAERELRNNPKAFLRRALGDTKTNKKTIDKAVASGDPIPEEKIAKIITKYRSDLLLSRAETIARTETLSSLHAGQREQYEQAIRDGLVSKEELQREWSTSGDNRVRESHAEMDGQIVGFDEPFITPSMAQLLYPGDPSGPAEEVINCRCYEIVRVDYLSRIGR